MTQIDPIDDYIEPQLIIQAKSKEIAAMTLKKDWVGADKANKELERASKMLRDWLWLSHIQQTVKLESSKK